MNSEQIREAQAVWQEEGCLAMTDDQVHALWEAARLYADLLENGEQIWWCEYQRGKRHLPSCHGAGGVPESHTECGLRILARVVPVSTTEEDK